MYFGRYDLFFEEYRICQESDNYRIDQKSLRFKGPQIRIISISDWGTYVLVLVLVWDRSMTNDEYKIICLKSVSGTHLVLKLEIKTKIKMKIKFKF
jgi:hypothetical protein